MNKITLVAKTLCLLLAGTMCVCFVSCKDEANNPDHGDNPGKITAIGSSSLESYAITGAVTLSVNVEKSDVTLDPSKFTMENFSVTGDRPIEETTLAQADASVPVISSIVKGTGNNYELVLSYDYNGYESCHVSFTLGYQDTSTAIPVSIKVTDFIRSMEVSQMVAGLKGSLSWTQNPIYGYLPPQGFAGLKDLVGTGAHAEDLSFEKLKYEYAVGLNDNFSFTPKEIEDGYASIPVKATWKCSDGQEFFTYTTFTTYPSRSLASVTIDSATLSYTWNVEAEAEDLGIDKDTDGNIQFGHRAKEFYLASGDGCLLPIKDYEYNIFASIGNTTEGDKSYPHIKLTGLSQLPQGKYMLVAHVKKVLSNPDNNLYVDFCIPIVKE